VAKHSHTVSFCVCSVPDLGAPAVAMSVCNYFKLTTSCEVLWVILCARSRAVRKQMRVYLGMMSREANTDHVFNRRACASVFSCVFTYVCTTTCFYRGIPPR